MAARHNERRPAGVASGRAQSTGTGDGNRLSARVRRRTDQTALTPPTPLDIKRRKAWAAAMVRDLDGPPARYGSAEWARLPETDRRRVAGVIVAAECWAEDSDNTADRLRREIDAARGADDQLGAEAFAAMAAGVRHLASVPTFEQLCERRGEPERAASARALHNEIRDTWNEPPGGAA